MPPGSLYLVLLQVITHVDEEVFFAFFTQITEQLFIALEINLLNKMQSKCPQRTQLVHARDMFKRFAEFIKITLSIANTVESLEGASDILHDRVHYVMENVKAARQRCRCVIEIACSSVEKCQGILEKVKVIEEAQPRVGMLLANMDVQYRSTLRQDNRWWSEMCKMYFFNTKTLTKAISIKQKKGGGMGSFLTDLF